MNLTDQADLEAEVFGKRVLITARDDWSVAEVITAYRSQPEAPLCGRATLAGQCDGVHPQQR